MEPDTVDFVQDEAEDASAIPLVLIHDGGGTVFAYWTLRPLQRHLYAIAYPGWDSGEAIEGGIPALAKLYCDMIRKHVRRGPILLGGWSLGSYLALEMSKLLAGDGDHQVVGLVMVDSPNPETTDGWSERPSKHLEDVTASLKPEIRKKVLRCMEISLAMVDGWRLPKWESAAACPPAILIRAERPVPGAKEPDGQAAIDTLRADPELGWDEYSAIDIRTVMTLPDRHHFDIFQLDTIEDVSQLIKNACDILCAK